MYIHISSWKPIDTHLCWFPIVFPARASQHPDMAVPRCSSRNPGKKTSRAMASSGHFGTRDSLHVMAVMVEL